MHTTTHAPISARPRSRTREVKSGVCDITCRARLLLQRALLVLAVIIGVVKNETSADEVAKAADRIVNTKFAAAVSMAVQDARSFDVFAIAPAERKIHRFTAKQLMTGDSTPAASFQFEGEPQRVIVRSIGDTQFAFVQCANPMMLVQLEAESLNVVHQIPLSTSVVSDMFASEALDDSRVWLVIDGKPATSRSTIRQWKLAVADFGGDVPTMVDLLNCSAALVTPDGKTVLTYNSGQGVTRSAVSFNSDRSLSLTVLPEQSSLAKIRLRPGSFFSPDRDAIIVAGQWLAMNDSVEDSAVRTPEDVGPVFSAPIISFLRSTPLAVCLSQRTLDDGTIEPSLQFVETPSGKVLSTLAIGDGVNLTRGGRDWRICETPDNSGLLHVTSTHVRFLTNAVLPAELKQLLNESPMTLQNRPDLTFRIGEVKEVPMQPTDPRCSMTLRAAPEGMTLTDGILRWQPGVVQQGKHTVEIEFIAGSLTKIVRLQARADFDVQKLPASYYRLAYSSKLQLLAGATITRNRNLEIDILRADDSGKFAVSHSVSLFSRATGLEFSSADGKTAVLAVSQAGNEPLLFFDPLSRKSTSLFDKSLSSVRTLTVGAGPQRSLLVYVGSQSNSGPFNCAGLVDLKSGKHAGFFCPMPIGKPGHPKQMLISLDPSRRNNQQIAIIQASISSDGDTVHFITRPNEGNGGLEYSEWTIPEDLSQEPGVLTCLYHTNIPELKGGIEDLRLLSGGTGFAAIRSTLFTFGQPSEPDVSLDEPHHFVTGRPFLIQSHVSDADRQLLQAGGAPAMKVSVVSLNGKHSVTPEFSLPMGPAIFGDIMVNTLLCVSDEGTKTVLMARGESLTRIPYAALAIDDQPFDPAVVVSGPRMLQAGNEYEFPLRVFPPEATVSIEKSPTGVRLEDNRLKWKVAADAGDQEAITLTVAHGEKSCTAETQFSVATAVPVAIDQLIPRYTFDRESGLIAGIDATTGLIVVFDVGQLRVGQGTPLRTLALAGPHELIQFKRVEDRLSLIVISDATRSVRVIDPESGDVQFDLTDQLPAGTNAILSSPDAKSPLVVLKSGQEFSSESSWRFLNVKTGEVSPPFLDQLNILSFSDEGNALALHNPRRQGQLMVADITNAAGDGSPVLTGLRSMFLSNTQLSFESSFDFQYRRLHQKGVVYSANGPMNGQMIPFEPLAFFEKSPFFLSMSVNEPATPNQQSGHAAHVEVTLTAVSRNTLKPVGRPVTLQIPRSPSGPAGFMRAQAYQVFVPNNEKTVLVTSPQACFVIPVEAMRLPDEVSLTMHVSGGAFSVGTESTIELQPTDDRATISISFLPEGMTFKENKLKWTPRLSDVGSYSLAVELQAGDQKRSETISIRAELPGMELPFALAGLSAEPQRNFAFVWGNPWPDEDADIDSLTKSPLCVIDLTKREIAAQSTIAADHVLVAMFEGQHVIIAAVDRSGPRLMVLNSSDLSVLADVPLQLKPGPIGLLRKDKTLLVTQKDRILRCSLPDLKWQDGHTPFTPEKPGAFPNLLRPEGIVQGPLTLNWDGSNQLWHVAFGGVFHAQRVNLRPEFLAAGSVAASSFTSENRRIVDAPGSSMIYAPSPSSKRSPLQANVIGPAERLNPSRISLRISPVVDPGSKLFQSETENAPTVPEGLVPSAAYPKEAVPMASDGSASDSVTILVDDLVLGTNRGWVETTDTLVIAGSGSRLWMVEYEQAELLLTVPAKRPTFVRQQSHFLLEGSGQTKLTHTIHGGNLKIRFATANRIRGVSVDSSTGDVTVDHKIIADSLKQEMMVHLRTTGVVPGTASPDASVVVRQISDRAKEIARQVVNTGTTLPEGIPVFVPIELVLLDDGQPVDALGYTVAVMVSEETIKATIDECLRKDVEMRTGKRSQPQDDVEELRRIIDRLEERLNRAESLLRENGLDVPKQ